MKIYRLLMYILLIITMQMLCYKIGYKNGQLYQDKLFIQVMSEHIKCE